MRQGGVERVAVRGVCSRGLCFGLVLSHFSRVWLFATAWTVARQAPLSMGFSRQECWGGQPFASPGDLPNPGIEPASPAFTDGSFTAEPPGEPRFILTCHLLSLDSGLCVDECGGVYCCSVMSERSLLAHCEVCWCKPLEALSIFKI